MRKYFRFLLVVFLMPLFITKVYAAEPTAEDVLASIQDSYYIDATEYESKTNGIESYLDTLIQADLSANGIDLAAMGYTGFSYVMEDIHTGYYDFFNDDFSEDYEKSFAITYSNTGTGNEADEAMVQDFMNETGEAIEIEEEVDFEEIDTHEYQYGDDTYLEDHVAEAFDGSNIQYYWSTYVGGGSYFSGGLVGEVQLFVDDVWYGTIGLSSRYIVKVYVPYIVEDVDSYVLDLLKTYLTSQGEEVENLVFEEGGVASEDGEYYYGEVRIFYDEGQEIAENVLVDSIYENIVNEPVDEEVQAELEELAKEKGYEETFAVTDVQTDDDISKGLNYTFQVGEEYNGKEVLIISRKDGEEDEFLNPVVENGKVIHTVTDLSLLGVFLPYVEEEQSEDISEEGSETVAEEAAAPVAVPTTYVPYVYGTDAPVLISDDEEDEKIAPSEEPKNDDKKIEEKEEKPKNKALLIILLVVLIIGVIYFMYMGSRD